MKDIAVQNWMRPIIDVLLYVVYRSESVTACRNGDVKCVPSIKINLQTKGSKV